MLADWVPAKYWANRFSRVHDASVRLELHVTAINRQVLQGPGNSSVESAFLHVLVSIIVKLLLDGYCCTWRWRFAILQPTLHNTTPLVFCVWRDFSPVMVQHSFTLEVFIPLARSLSRSRALEIVHICTSMNTSSSLFAKNCGAASHLSKLRSSRRSAMKSTQRVSARLQPHSCFSQSPKHGGTSSPMQPAVPTIQLMGPSPRESMHWSRLQRSSCSR